MTRLTENHPAPAHYFSSDLTPQQHTAAAWFFSILMLVGAVILVWSYWPEITGWLADTWNDVKENDQ